MAEDYRIKYEKLQRDFISKEVEISELENQVSRLQVERSKIPPDRLISSFGDSLEKVQVSLAEKSTRVKYLVSDLEVELKANVTFSDDEIFYQLPKLDDTLPSENLSIIRFKINMLPREEAEGEDVFGYDEVPNLIGLNPEDAKYRIESKGFKVGEITYESTDRIQPGLVLGQMPSAFSLAAPESPVDITISEPAESSGGGVKVPNLVGLPLEEAKEVLKSLGLVLGKVSKRKSTSPPDTVISQSIKVDEGVEPETAIDLVLAEKEKKKRKKTVGVREIEGIGNVYSARLEKSNIKTLNKLASSPSSKIAEATGVSEKMAETWKAMAVIHDEDMGRNGAELLVKSGDIRSVDDLKKADPEELYGKLDRAIKLHKVRVPLEFTLKKEDVARWVKKAKDER